MYYMLTIRQISLHEWKRAPNPRSEDQVCVYIETSKLAENTETVPHRRLLGSGSSPSFADSFSGSNDRVTEILPNTITRLFRDRLVLVIFWCSSTYIEPSGH